MRQPKEVILDSLKRELDGLQDESVRMVLEFRNYSPEALNKKYLSSDQTPNQIISDNKVREEELRNAIRWANTL